MKKLSIILLVLLLLGCKKENSEDSPLVPESIIQKKTIDIIPDFVLNYPISDYQLDINQDGISDIVFTSYGYASNNFTLEEMLVQSKGVFEIAAYDNSPASNDLALCADSMIVMISDSADWSMNSCTLVSYNFQALPPPGESSYSGPWLNKNDKFLIVRHLVNDEQLYAWVKISNGWGIQLIVKEFTYEYK